MSHPYSNYYYINVENVENNNLLKTISKLFNNAKELSATYNEYVEGFVEYQGAKYHNYQLALKLLTKLDDKQIKDFKCGYHTDSLIKAVTNQDYIHFNELYEMVEPDVYDVHKRKSAEESSVLDVLVDCWDKTAEFVKPALPAILGLTTMVAGVFMAKKAIDDTVATAEERMQDIVDITSTPQVDITVEDFGNGNLDIEVNYN